MRVAAVIALFALCSSAAYAQNSVGGSVTAGSGFTEVAVGGRVDVKEQWSYFLDYAHDETSSAGASVSHLVKGGASYEHPDESIYDAGLAFWRDTTNLLSYWGPTFGYVRPVMQQRREGVQELFTLIADVDLFLYSADVPNAEPAATQTRRKAALAAGATTRAVRIAQFHPTVGVSVPMLGERLISSASVGHYFYSADPAELESAVSSSPVLASSGASMMTGNLYRNNWNLAVTGFLTPIFSLRGDIGGAQRAIDRSWSSTAGVQVRYTFARRYRFKLGWSRSNTTSTNYYTAGFTYFF